MQVAQNKVLRLTTNSEWRTRITTLHERAEIDPVDDHIRRLYDKFLATRGD